MRLTHIGVNVLLAIVFAFSTATACDIRPAASVETLEGANIYNVRISQVYTVAGYSGSAYTKDYVELFNAGPEPVSLNGWSVQTFDLVKNYHILPLGPVTIQPYHYLLIQYQGGAYGKMLPTPDLTVSWNIQFDGHGGVEVLVRNTEKILLTGWDEDIVDLFAWGPVFIYEGSGPGPVNTTQATSAHHRPGGGCVDTNDNQADISLALATPRNSAAPANYCELQVVATTPAADATGVATDAALGVTFSEAVTVTDPWFSIACSSGPRTAVASSTDKTTFSLDPELDFALGDTCAVTIDRSRVVAADNPTARLPQDAAWTFHVFDPVRQCGGAATAIEEIQGDGATSPLIGQEVIVEGVVSGDFQGSTELGGFFISSLAEAVQPGRSRGLFVYDPNGSDVTPGERVRVHGTVSEYEGLTELNQVDSSVICGTGDVPAPVALPLPLPEGASLEAYEGMPVTFPDELTISGNAGLWRYGQLLLSWPGRITHANPGGEPAPGQMRLALDDGSGGEYPAETPYLDASGTRRSGDRLAAGQTGILDEGAVAGGGTGYRLQPLGAPAFIAANPRPAAPGDVGGNVRVASLNTDNFFTTAGSRGADGPEELARQTEKLAAAIAALDADVIALQEIESDPEAEALAALVAATNARLGAPDYAAVERPAGGVGSDAIMNALIYRPARVTVLGAPLSAGEAIFERAPLAQAFRTADGEAFSVVAVHLKARGDCPADAEDANADHGQGCWNERRTQQAAALLEFVAAAAEAAGDPDVLVTGDFNAYPGEAPLLALAAGGLEDALAGRIAPEADYTTVFAGAAGRLDGALATAGLRSQVSGAAIWHVNADEPAFLDYQTEERAPWAEGNPADRYAADAYRAADHDALLVGLRPGAGPRLSSDDLSGEYRVGAAQEFHVRASNPAEGSDYGRVRFSFRITDAKLADVTLFQYLEGDAWLDLPLVESGEDLTGFFGPAEGMAMPAGYAATSAFQINFARAGRHAVRITLDDLDVEGGPGTLAELRGAVSAAWTPPALSVSGLAGELTAGAAEEFQATAENPAAGCDHAQAAFRLTIRNAAAGDVSGVEVYDGAGWVPATLAAAGSDLSAELGPAGGAALPAGGTLSRQARITFARPGTYTLRLALIDLASETELASLETQATAALHLPQLASDDIQGPYQQGVAKTFHVQTTHPANGLAYARVRFDFLITGAQADDVAALEYWDGAGWQPLPLSADGGGLRGYFGPAEGFALPPGYSAKTTLRVEFAHAGTYGYQLTLDDLDGGKALAELSGAATVSVPGALVLSTLDLGGAAAVGEERAFHASVSNPADGRGFAQVGWRLHIGGAAAGDVAALRYLAGEAWQDAALTAEGDGLSAMLSATGGTPLPAGAEGGLAARIAFARAGSYALRLTLVDLATDAPLGSLEATAEVIPDPPGMSCGDLGGTYRAGVAQAFHPQVSNPAGGRDYGRVGFSLRLEGVGVKDVPVLEAWDGTGWQPMHLALVAGGVTATSDAGFGLGAGAGLDATIRIRLDRPGSHALTLALVDLEGGQVLASCSATAKVEEFQIYLPLVRR